MMKVWKICFLFILVVCLWLAIVAARPLQEGAGTQWQDVFKALILLAVAVAGSPITQLLKNLLKVEGRVALLLTGMVAAGIAVLEMWLSGILNFSQITVDNFPATFTAVMTVATFYYGLLKGTEGVFGKKLLLKPIPKKPAMPPMPNF
jgi:hypothetical protein